MEALLFEKKQINGQRRIRRISGASSSGEGFEIFIQNLPNDAYEEELMPLLEQFGEVTELRIMMNFSGFTRGFAYAKFANQNSSAEAVRHLNRHEIRPGFKITVQHSLDKKKLFIGNLPISMTRSDLIMLLNTLTPNIEKIDFSERGNSKSVRVTYKTHSDAAAARRVLIPNRKKIFTDWVVIEWAVPKKKWVKSYPVPNSVGYSPTTKQMALWPPAPVFPFGPGRPLRRTRDQYGPPASAIFSAEHQEQVMFYRANANHRFAWNSPAHPTQPLSAAPFWPQFTHWPR